MVSDRQGSVTSEEPTRSSDPGGFSLEGPTMVPNLAGDAVQLSLAASSVTKPIAVRVQHGPDGVFIPSSRVACLRHKFGCGNLSESAKELILSSWRGKHPELMTPISKSGWAGVLNGVVIPFQDPFLML